MKNGLFGFLDTRSPEERAQEEAAYLQRIFPYGMAQRDKVARLLAAVIPSKHPELVLMCYILTKEDTIRPGGPGFDQAFLKAQKVSRFAVGAEHKERLRLILEADCAIGRELHYPAPEALARQPRIEE